MEHNAEREGGGKQRYNQTDGREEQKAQRKQIIMKLNMTKGRGKKNSRQRKQPRRRERVARGIVRWKGREKVNQNVNRKPKVFWG